MYDGFLLLHHIWCSTKINSGILEMGPPSILEHFIEPNRLSVCLAPIYCSPFYFSKNNSSRPIYTAQSAICHKNRPAPGDLNCADQVLPRFFISMCLLFFLYHKYSLSFFFLIGRQYFLYCFTMSNRLGAFCNSTIPYLQ